ALGTEQLEGAANDAVGIDRDERIYLRAGVIDQAANDAIEALDLACDAIGDFLLCPATAQHLEVRTDRAERVADLMRDAGCEASDTGELLRAHELALGIEQPVRHAIQPLGERGEVAGIAIGGPGA